MAQLEQLSVHFPVNMLALKRGGLVRAVMRRANTLAAGGNVGEVWIEVLSYQRNLAADVEALRRDRHLHPGVRVRSVLYGLDPSPKDASQKPLKLDGAGLVRLPRAPGRRARWFRDGVCEREAQFHLSGELKYVDHLAPGGGVVRRDEYARGNQLVRVLHYDSPGGSPTVQRWIGRDGSCFLTIWQEAGAKTWQRAFLLGGTPREFDQVGTLYQHAFERLLAPEEQPVLFSEFRENLYNLPDRGLDDIVSSVRHPRLRIGAVAHSNHHRGPTYTPKSGVGDNWDELLARLGSWDGLFVPTEAQRRDILDRYGEQATVLAIPQVSVPAVAERAPVDPHRLVLVARIHRKKRVDEALRAFAGVLAQVPEAYLDVFGFGYGDEEEADVMSLLDQLGVREQVRFRGFAESLGDIYDGACATLISSASEGFPLNLLESMAYGVPVVSYDLSYGPSDVIVDGENGYLVPSGDHAALAARLVALMTDPQLRERLGSAAHGTVGRYDAAAHQRLWEEGLVTITSSPGRAHPAVTGVSWADGGLALRLDLPESWRGAHVVLRDRGGDEVTSVPLADDLATVVLPPSEPGHIFDFFLRQADGGSEQRLLYAPRKVFRSGPLEAYGTEAGNLSIKHHRPDTTPAPARLIPRRAVPPRLRRLARRLQRR